MFFSHSLNPLLLLLHWLKHLRTVAREQSFILPSPVHWLPLILCKYIFLFLSPQSLLRSRAVKLFISWMWLMQLAGRGHTQKKKLHEWASWRAHAMPLCRPDSHDSRKIHIGPCLLTKAPDKISLADYIRDVLILLSEYVLITHCFGTNLPKKRSQRPCHTCLRTFESLLYVFVMRLKSLKAHWRQLEDCYYYLHV